MSEVSNEIKERDNFLEFAQLGANIYKAFNSGYSKILRDRVGVPKRLFQKENRISIPMNREPKPAIKLDTMTKERFETAFDTSLEDVRIHTGEYATELTRRADAEAVTVGSDIFFSQGNFSLDSEEGLILLAHELQHVVQYKNGKRMEYREDLESMESEAERVESLMKGNNLHGFTGGVLNQSETPTIDREASNSTNQMATNDIASSGTIDDFTNSNTETIYRLRIGTKVLEVTKKERDLIIKRAAEKLGEKFESELMGQSDNMVDRSLLSFMEFVETY